MNLSEVWVGPHRIHDDCNTYHTFAHPKISVPPYRSFTSFFETKIPREDTNSNRILISQPPFGARLMKTYFSKKIKETFFLHTYRINFQLRQIYSSEKTSKKWNCASRFLYGYLERNHALKEWCNSGSYQRSFQSVYTKRENIDLDNYSFKVKS